MARDYKPRTTDKGRRKASSESRRSVPGWTWMVGGFALGLATAYAVLVYQRGFRPSPAVATTAPAVPAKPRARPPDTSHTRFEFYSLLPEMEVVVPESEVAATAPAPSGAARPPNAPAREPARYILQVGAFRNLEDADRLRATLALTGLEAKIQTVAIDGRATWHRVRLGPYTNLHALQAARARLRRVNIDPIILKIKT